MLGSSALFLLLGVLLLAVVLILFISFKGKGASTLNREKYQAHWLAIENGISRDNLPACQLAIMNADKLVDMALRDCRYKGENMGERMKSANAVWKNSNNIWTAHKVRNKLAHEPGATVSYELTLQTLSAFKQGLKDLGAI